MGKDDVSLPGHCHAGLDIRVLRSRRLKIRREDDMVVQIPQRGPPSCAPKEAWKDIEFVVRDANGGERALLNEILPGAVDAGIGNQRAILGSLVRSAVVAAPFGAGTALGGLEMADDVRQELRR
jgi:hypothetical protein